MLFHKGFSHGEMVKFLQELERQLTVGGDNLPPKGIVERIKKNKESFQDVLYLKIYGVETIDDMQSIREFLKYNFKDGNFLPEKVK